MNFVNNIKFTKKTDIEPLPHLSHRQNLERKKNIQSHYGIFGYRKIGMSIEELKAYADDVYLRDGE